MVAAVTATLLWMFSSVLFKGIGRDRSVPEVLLVALAGTGVLIVQFAFLYRWTGLVDPLGNPSDSIRDALYFSTVTWTTLGYGDFLPGPEARHIVVVEALLGYVMMALLVAAFVAGIARPRPDGWRLALRRGKRGRCRSRRRAFPGS